MRERRSGRRRKRQSSCSMAILKWLLLLSLFLLLGFGIRQWADETGLKNRVLRNQYPIKYQDLVEHYAKEFQLDPYLVYAVIRSESKFDPYAVSSANAKGLMQLQDSTAEECAAMLKMDHFMLDDLFEPKTNIRLGCCYLSKLLKLYDGHIETAVIAYNGGPGNVGKWLEDEELTNDQGELVTIPFGETQNYVKNVMESYQKYKELYE